jgi:uncharacterized protein (DUF2237 family)
MNLQENILRIREMMEISDMNILDEPLQICGKNPMTGYYRDGYCKTGSSDEGIHTVCSEVDDQFLEFTKSKGNDLSFLKSGDKWCLCANRWKEAYDEGVAPKVIKNSTNKKTLDVIGDVIFDKNIPNIEDDNKRVVFDMKDLLDRGIIFITQAHDLSTGKMIPPEKDSNTGEMYYDSTNLITLYNIKNPEKGTQDFIYKALEHPRPDQVQYWQDTQSQLEDEKYEQIIKSIELNDKDIYDTEDEELAEYSRTLKNARQQGVGLRFPKSAIKSNPLRFRPYNR